MSVVERMPSYNPGTSRSPSVNAVPTMASNANAIPPDPIRNLKSSQNAVAAGIGEALEALALAASGPPVSTKPIFVEWEGRVMALGRKRMAGLGSGKNAFLYLKSKFGLLSAARPLYLQASFHSGAEEDFVEVDLDAWEELAPHIEKLRIIA